MAINYILAPNGRWQGRDETGQPVQNGKLYTYLNQTTTPKATYQDYQGLQPNTNPVILDGKGEANIYWAIDDLYTYKLFTEDDEEVTTQDNYPIVGTNTTRVVQESQVNICRNEQFAFWYYGTSFSPVKGNGSQSNTDFFADDWLYRREDITYTVNISQQTFAIDQTVVPNNPKYYFRYECSSTPATETNTRLYQRYTGVQTFAGQAVVVSLYAKSPTASVVNVYLDQDFGTGGSPSTLVPTLIGQFTLTTSWERYSGTITIPSLNGKTLGTNGDDALVLRLAFPNDVSATVDCVNMQIQQGSDLTAFPYEVLDNQFKELNDRIDYGIASTGDVKATIKTTADNGWIMMNDQTIGNVTSGADNVGFSLKALYSLIWSNVSATYAPIYDSAGVLSTRGADANADFNALKRLALTKTLGRIIASAGTAVLAQVFTADPATDLLTVLNATGAYYNGTPVVVSNTGGGLPAPLAAATTYYATGASGTTLKLSTTLSNAINGIFIDITTAGTGVQTVTINYAAYTLGQWFGEATHGITPAEIPNLNVTVSQQSRDGAPTGGGNIMTATGALTGYTDQITGNTTNGLSGVHNNVQPTVFLRYMIKL